jgi:hypothetical protein
MRKCLIHAMLLLVVPATAAGEEVPIVPPPDAYELQEVRDDYWLRHEDTPAYYGLLDHARRVPREQLRTAGREFLAQRGEETGLPTFVDMLRNSSKYRGQPVFLTGHVLQTVEYDAAENPYGIEKLYETSLYTEDARHNLTTVVFLEKPDELPLGGETVDGVEVAGYFLKLYWYPAGDNQTHKAPLILARTVTVRPPTAHGPLVPPEIGYPLLLAGFILLVTVVWRIQQSDNKRMLERRKKELDSQQPDFDGLAR